MAIQKRPAATPAPGRPQAVPAQQRAVPAQRVNGQDQAQGVAFASLNPEDYTQGGLLDDVDVTFTECRFCEWDYNGTIDHPVLALCVGMDYVDAEGKNAHADQYYSAGELNRFVPSEDGTHAVSVAGAKGLAGGTNAADFLKSVIGQGFPVARFGDGDVSAMDGMYCHIVRSAQAKRGGQITGKTKSGYDTTIALVVKIHRMPWEASAAPKSRTGTPAARPAANAKPGPSRSTAAAQSAQVNEAAEVEGSTDVREEAAGILLAVLNAKNGSVKKMSIAPASFKLLSGNPNRSEILNLLADDEFLGTDEYGWTYDGATVNAQQ